MSFKPTRCRINLNMSIFLDVNECDRSPCRGRNEVCVNIAASYRCTCKSGYERSGSNCFGMSFRHLVFHIYFMIYIYIYIYIYSFKFRFCRL